MTVCTYFQNGKNCSPNFVTIKLCKWKIVKNPFSSYFLLGQKNQTPVVSYTPGGETNGTVNLACEICNMPWYKHMYVHYECVCY